MQHTTHILRTEHAIYFTHKFEKSNNSAPGRGAWKGNFTATQSLATDSVKRTAADDSLMSMHKPFIT